MAMYPEVQKKAQEEIDRVVGPNRLPDFSDQDTLPYVNAVVKESLRWKLVVPTGASEFSLSLSKIFLLNSHTSCTRSHRGR